MSRVRRDPYRASIVEYILAQPASKRLDLDALIRWYFKKKRGERRTPSDETRKKLSDAAKRQWQRVREAKKTND